MTLKNVEKMEQHQVEKTWFQRFRSKLAGTAVVGTGALVAIPAHAEIPDFLADASGSLTGIATSLGGVFLLAIGITLVIIAFTTSRGGIKRAG